MNRRSQRGSSVGNSSVSVAQTLTVDCCLWCADQETQETSHLPDQIRLWVRVLSAVKSAAIIGLASGFWLLASGFWLRLIAWVRLISMEGNADHHTTWEGTRGGDLLENDRRMWKSGDGMHASFVFTHIYDIPHPKGYFQISKSLRGRESERK